MLVQMEKMAWLLVAVFIVIQLQFNVAHCEPLTLTLLEDAVQMGAVCLDGSPPGYYYRAGSGDGADKWIVHFIGGGWCQTMEECYERSFTSSGSSSPWSDGQVLHGLLSDDETLNPDFYNWNAVSVIYCDGGSFSGNRLVPDIHEGRLIYYRGYLNLQAVFDHLEDVRGFSSATDVILTGCSAGGLSTLLHADFVKSNYAPNANFVALPDAGYFIVIPGMMETGPDLFISMMEIQNIDESIMPACREAHETQLWKCLYAPYIYEYIQTPTYVLNSRMDIFVIGGTIISPDSSVTFLEYPEEFDEQAQPVISNLSSGYFFDSCLVHCQATPANDGWNDYKINNISIQTSFGDWYYGRSNVTTRLKEDCNIPPCNPTCSLFDTDI